MFIDKNHIGAKIKEFRKKKKLSQAQLAELTGLSDKHIGRIEAGKYFPNFINFLNIMNAVNLDFKTLGLEVDSNNSKELDELLKYIYASKENEISLYLRLIKAYKNEKP